MTKEEMNKEEEMAKIVVDKELCKSCNFCVIACPQKILKIGEELNGKGYKVAEQFDEEKCTACKLCAIACPESAIEVYK